jgi:hypothetical protein
LFKRLLPLLGPILVTAIEADPAIGVVGVVATLKAIPTAAWAGVVIANAAHLDAHFVGLGRSVSASVTSNVNVNANVSVKTRALANEYINDLPTPIAHFPSAA